MNNTDNLSSLNGYFSSEKNNLTVMYSRVGMGKTTLIKKFISDKQSVYYSALPLVESEALKSYIMCASEQLSVDIQADNYSDAFLAIMETVAEPLVLVFEDFQNLVRVDQTFMAAIEALVRGRLSDKKVMVILTSNLVSWVENSMVKSIKTAAFCINVFMKLREHSYADTVSMFPDCDARRLLYIYAISGGVPAYMRFFEENKSIKYNICKLMLSADGALRNEAERFIRDEFREISVYNVILGCLARGMNKLNEIHEYTGYGRDKISVYLSNLIEREIVQKGFSYEKGGKQNTRKGLYKITDSYISFWYRFIYPYYGRLDAMEPEAFYDRYIKDSIEDFVLEGYIKVATEFLDIMIQAGRIPKDSEYKGRWYGKTGDVHIIYENAQGQKTVAQVYAKKDEVGVDEYNILLENLELSAKNPDKIYLFATSGFSNAFTAKQAGGHLTLVNIDDL